MTWSVRVLRRAQLDLVEIQAYVARDRPGAAEALVDALVRTRPRRPAPAARPDDATRPRARSASTRSISGIALGRGTRVPELPARTASVPPCWPASWRTPAGPYELVRTPADGVDQAFLQVRAPPKAYCPTPDSLHLAVMQSLEVRQLLTNDDAQPRAARALGFAVAMPR